MTQVVQDHTLKSQRALGFEKDVGRKMTSILDQLLTLIARIPAAFWGVVIGSFFSLGGIVIANRANDRRLQKQLRHDREMRNRDRELSLRKDVYLSVAEAVLAGIVVIGRIADLDIPNNKVMEAYADKAPAIAKAHVIANERTIEVLTNLVGELNAVTLRMFTKRFPLTALKTQISNLQQQISSFSQQRDRMLELMKQFNLNGATDQRRLDVINANFQFEQNRIAETYKQQAILFGDLAAKQLQLLKECTDETIRLSRFTVPFITSVRVELEMPIDERAYAEAIEQSIRKQEASMKDFLEYLRSLSTSQLGSAQEARESAPR